jgi:hypothetical protein
MTKSVAVLFGVALALTVSTAMAQNFMSANRGMEGCRSFLSRTGDLSGPDPVGEGYCLGLVTGMMSMGRSLTGAAAEAAPGLCLNVPAGVTAAQAVRVVAAYIEARPSRMHEPFGALALEALRTAWPCR